MLLHIPDGILVDLLAICHNLVLIVAPVGQLFATETQRSARGVMNQSDLRFDGMPAIPLGLSI